LIRFWQNQNLASSKTFDLLRHSNVEDVMWYSGIICNANIHRCHYLLCWNSFINTVYLCEL